MINIFMATPFVQYPLGEYAAEQPWWLNFYSAPYSLINVERGRIGIQQRAQVHVKLPFPREVGYSATHEFGQGWSPIIPNLFYSPNIANNGGSDNDISRGILRSRMNQSARYVEEYNAASSENPIKRFTNLTELTMVSEARKKYVFEYIFAPKNNAESLAVENVVGTFRKFSYPVVALGLPERSYPQKLWVIKVTNNNSITPVTENPDAVWLGTPLPCVLKSVAVRKNDKNDPIIRILPNGYSNFTMMSLTFEEFETGTFDPIAQEILSKSEISAQYFGNTQTPT